MLLSFNYTELVENYSNKKIGNAIYIHGKLSESKSIIFGYGDELDTNYKISTVFDCVYKNKEYPNDHNIVYPLIETDEYILFCNSMELG